MTAVKPEVFTGLFHALTFNHHKDKGQGPLESLDVRDTFIRLCAPFLPRLSLFFSLVTPLTCFIYESVSFSVVPSGPVCEKGGRGPETPAWPVVRVVVLVWLLAKLREWSHVPRKAVQQPKVGGPERTFTETSGKYIHTLEHRQNVWAILTFFCTRKPL